MSNLFDMTDLWNNVATTFTGVKLNVTNTASAAGSLLMDLQVGGTSKFSVNKFGRVIIGDDLHANSAVAVTNNAGLFKLGAYGDVILARDAANTPALRNGTAAQTFNVYGSYTDVSNGDYVSISKAAGGDVNISAQGVGTGFGGSIVFGVPLSGGAGAASSNVWKITQGNLIAVSTNVYDIGTSVTVGAPRNIYAGTNLVAGRALFTAGSKIAGQADGVFRFSNNAGTQAVDFTVGASNLLTLNGGLKTTGATFALQTATTLTDNAAAQVATMTNGPAAGNPTKWIAINDNGVTRYIPAW